MPKLHSALQRTDSSGECVFYHNISHKKTQCIFCSCLNNLLLQENHAVTCGTVMMFKGSPGGVAETRTVGQSGLQETLLVGRSSGEETQSVGQCGLQETLLIGQSGLQQTPAVGQSGVPVRLTKRPVHKYLGQSGVQDQDQLFGQSVVPETQLIVQADIQETQPISQSGAAKRPAPKYFGLPRGRTNCQYCGQAQASIRDKDLHERKSEYREISQVCGSINCFESFAASCQLYEHSRSQHSVHKLECALCNNIFQSSDSLIVHMASDHPNRYVVNKEQQKDKEQAGDSNMAIGKGDYGEITDQHQLKNDFVGQPSVYKNNFLQTETADKTFDETDHCDDFADKNIGDTILKKENQNVEGMGIDGYSQFLDNLNSIFKTKEDLGPGLNVGGPVTGGGEEVRKEEKHGVGSEGLEAVTKAEVEEFANVSPHSNFVIPFDELEDGEEVTYQPSEILKQLPRSLCWQFYVFKQGEDRTPDRDRVFCKVCDKCITYCIGGVTTNLNHHLKKSHLKEYIAAERRRSNQ